MQASRGFESGSRPRLSHSTYDPSVVTDLEGASPQPPQSPSPSRFDAGRAGSTITFVVALLYLGDTFLAWQRACVRIPGGFFIGSFCVRLNAWHGAAAGLGAISAIAAIVLLLWEGMRLAGADLSIGVEHRVVTTVLAGAIVVAAVLKWALVLGKFAGPGAWLGLILAAVLAGWVTLQPRLG
jgi:hypothetical protein